MEMKERLIGKDIGELKEVASCAGLPGYAASQIAQWLYGKRVKSVEDMTNISKAGRAVLADRYEVGIAGYSTVQKSSDGTKKYLFPVGSVHGEDMLPGCHASGHPAGSATQGNVADKDTGTLERSAVEAVKIPDRD